MTTPATCTAPTSPRFIRISPAALRAAYADPDRTIASIAAEFGMSMRGMRKRIKAIGEAPRSLATKRPSITLAQEPLFRQAWAEGVPAGDMAEHFGVSYRTICNTVERLWLPKRRPGVKGKVRMAHILQGHMATAMARTAAMEQAAIINAEMADRLSEYGRGGGVARFVGAAAASQTGGWNGR
jgi:hypothetical protein